MDELSLMSVTGCSSTKQCKQIEGNRNQQRTTHTRPGLHSCSIDDDTRVGIELGSKGRFLFRWATASQPHPRKQPAADCNRAEPFIRFARWHTILLAAVDWWGDSCSLTNHGSLHILEFRHDSIGPLTQLPRLNKWQKPETESPAKMRDSGNCRLLNRK